MVNLAFSLASLFIAVMAPVPKGIPTPVSAERVQNILVMETQDCVGKREGSEEWCRSRAELKISSAHRP